MVKKPVPITIDDMEETAKQDQYSVCLKAIRGNLLKVEYCLNGDKKYFEYTWGMNKVPREVAINVLASA